MSGRPKPTPVLSRLAAGWIAAASPQRDRALTLSPAAEMLRQALVALRAGRKSLAGATIRSAPAVLRAARRALAAGNRQAAETMLARALLAAV